MSAFFVEVKPVFAFPEDVAKRLDALKVENKFLIVGATLFEGYNLCFKIGFFSEKLDSEGKIWSEAILIQDRQTKKYGFIEPYGGWDNRITGEYKGDAFNWVWYGNEKIWMMWREAGNIVQWRKKR